MEWLLIVVFVIFIAGIGMVALDAIRHAEKNNPQG